MAAVLQPMPTVQVELDKDGHIVGSKAVLRGQQWQAMAKASGWSDGEFCRQGGPGWLCGSRCMKVVFGWRAVPVVVGHVCCSSWACLLDVKTGLHGQ